MTQNLTCLFVCLHSKVKECSTGQNKSFAIKSKKLSNLFLLIKGRHAESEAGLLHGHPFTDMDSPFTDTDSPFTDTYFCF